MEHRRLSQVSGLFPEYDDADAALGWMGRVFDFSASPARSAGRDGSERTFQADIYAGPMKIGVSGGGTNDGGKNTYPRRARG
ncbi:hypothetical protein [Streptomyces bicolor]|uniref:hypothetical protein n=1 Tax=Streptomyces bicolor TaxID=66874 RepID=UPI0004E24EC0|nr:hypothetical protein [Streptomyces bicolor]